MSASPEFRALQRAMKRQQEGYRWRWWDYLLCSLPILLLLAGAALGWLA